MESIYLTYVDQISIPFKIERRFFLFSLNTSIRLILRGRGIVNVNVRGVNDLRWRRSRLYDEIKSGNGTKEEKS